MITAIIASIEGLGEDYGDYTSVRGNGKDMTMNYFLHEDKLGEDRAIITNYKCLFADKILPFQKIIEEIDNNKEYYQKKGVSVGITEIQTALNSLGSSQLVIKACTFFAAQTRKRNCDVYYNLQVLKEVNNRWRNQTDTILRPIKIHSDGSVCTKDRCKETDEKGQLLKHYIIVHSIKPPIPQNILIDDDGKEFCISCEDVGKLYDSDEIIFDEFKIPEKSKRVRNK